MYTEVMRITNDGAQCEGPGRDEGRASLLDPIWLLKPEHEERAAVAVRNWPEHVLTLEP
jgi:hypothetical protein